MKFTTLQWAMCGVEVSEPMFNHEEFDSVEDARAYLDRLKDVYEEPLRSHVHTDMLIVPVYVRDAMQR